MRGPIMFAGAVAIGAAVAGAAPAYPDDERSPQAKYERLIAGKTAGDPVDCIETRVSKPELSAYGPRLVYRVSADLVYVNQTAGGCERVERGDALVTRQFQTRLCRGDIARTVDLPVGIDTGSCALGAFTPYRSR